MKLRSDKSTLPCTTHSTHSIKYEIIHSSILKIIISSSSFTLLFYVYNTNNAQDHKIFQCIKLNN